jgi:hypothetical protein
VIGSATTSWKARTAPVLRIDHAMCDGPLQGATSRSRRGIRAESLYSEPFANISPPYFAAWAARHAIDTAPAAPFRSAIVLVGSFSRMAHILRYAREPGYSLRRQDNGPISPKDEASSD